MMETEKQLQSHKEKIRERMTRLSSTLHCILSLHFMYCTVPDAGRASEYRLSEMTVHDMT
jgi:hypothetical protein